MSESNRCQRCGSLLPQIGGLFGRCPECMLELSFEETSDDGEFPATIGRYRILRLIGEGGMGAVYEAEQEHPSRLVALKIIKLGLATPALLRRFEQEAQALGRLQHPGIAQIYEAGTVDTGFGLQPYFAMELIRGNSPRDYSEINKLSTSERLEIMAKICEAVHHAHQRGLIHRDLKPANILVDQSGQPKVLDFGVARVTDSDSRATSQTDVGQLIGTLAYMSPEQVLADPFDIDTRSDVYSLGVVLYELLTGRLPYDVSRKIHEAIQTIRDTDPQRLSTFRSAYRGDIETIAAKALEKDKSRRYESAAEMAGDIRRYLRDEPIVARPQSAIYLLRKFRKRNRALVLASAVVLFVLIAAVTVSALLAVRAVRERDRADAQTRVAGQALASAQVNLYHNNIDLSEREWGDANIIRSDQLLNESPAALRNWEWNYLSRRNHEEDAVLAGHRRAIVALAFVDDGKRLRTVSLDRTFKDWDLETRKEVATGRFGPTDSNTLIVDLRLSTNGRILSYRISPQFRPDDRRTWDLSTGREVLTVSGNSLSSKIRDLYGYNVPAVLAASSVFSPDGSRLAGTTGAGVSIVNAATGEQLMVLDNSKGAVTRLTFNPDGAVIAGAQDQGVVAWRTGDGKTLWRVPSGTVTSLAFSPDTTLIATALTDRTIRILDGTTGREISRLTVRTDAIYALGFTPNGKQLVSAGDDNLVYIWNLPRAPERSLNAGVLQAPVQVASDGKTILLPTLTGMKLLDVNTGRFRLELPGAATQSGAGLSRDGSRIATLKRDGPNLYLEVMDTRTGREIVTFRPADSRLASSEERSSPRADSRYITNRPENWRIGDPQLSPSGDRTALLLREISSQRQFWRTYLDILETDGGKRINVSQFENVIVGPLRFSPNGKRVATVIATTGGSSGAAYVEIYDAMTGKRLRQLTVSPPTDIPILAFTADGNQLAEVVDRMTLTIWDIRSGEKVVSFPRFSKGVADVAFSPDGTRLVSVSPAGEVWLWDSQSGKALIPLRESGGSYSSLEVPILSSSNGPSTFPRDRSVAFDPTGQRITMTSVTPDPKGHKVRISTWDGSPGR